MSESAIKMLMMSSAYLIFDMLTPLISKLTCRLMKASLNINSEYKLHKQGDKAQAPVPIGTFSQRYPVFDLDFSRLIKYKFSITYSVVENLKTV